MQIFPVSEKNSLRHWTKIINPLRVVFNFILIQITRYSPSLELKCILYRILGMKVGKNVSPGLMCMVDIFFPQYISIGENTILGYNSTILCHEFLIDEYRLGRVVIGSRVMIGANATILPGVTIGDGAVIGAGSLVDKDVEPYTFVAGVPIKKIKDLQVSSLEQAEENDDKDD
ncbi:MAG: acyltransferase [Bacillota bacterium]